MFPANARAVRVFLAMESQWRFRPNGRRAGLDYAALRSVPDMMRLSRKKYRDTFERLRVLEAAALERIAQWQP